MSDAAIHHILGREMGDDFLTRPEEDGKRFTIQQFHDAQIEYEVLAGSSLAAKRTMSQSLVMLTQILDNPQIQEMLSTMDKAINIEAILDMWLEASEWKNKGDVIKPMTLAQIQRRDANSKAALQQGAMQAKQQSDQQKFQQKSQLEDQASDNRIKRDITREAAKASGMSQAVTGEPSMGAGALQGEMPVVE